jgi:hypothetical protein
MRVLGILSKITSESPDAANANTGAPSGDQTGSRESAVMATSPETSPNSQSTGPSVSATVGRNIPDSPQAVKVLDLELVGGWRSRSGTSHQRRIANPVRPNRRPAPCISICGPEGYRFNDESGYGLCPIYD